MTMLVGCQALDEQFHAVMDDEEIEQQATMQPVTTQLMAERGLSYQPDSQDRINAVQAPVQGSWQDPLVTGYQPDRTHKGLADYASQLAMQLMDNASSMSRKDLIGVTSFVRLNRSLQEPTVMGNQLSELLIAELQQYGLGVVDFKVTDDLVITPYGDIAMGREGDKLARKMHMDHLLTGTLIEEARGVRVNARIVSTQNKQVVASTSLLIPAFIVTQLNRLSLSVQNNRQLD
ncbi:hypothetical protein KO518_16045 [Aestuariibacter sp. A3R04]|nr:hypothetical protein [Aestuariibacter sp. A3R04]